MSTPISNTDEFNSDKTQWSGNQTIDNSSTQPILNELNWSANPNTYINGKPPQSFWSPAEESDLKPVIWNDFVVISATANFSNNGNSPSTLNMKLIPNKTFFERAKTTKHYTTLFDMNGEIGHDKNIYSDLQPKYDYFPNINPSINNISIYRGNTFTNFDYKNLSSSNSRYNSSSFTRTEFSSTDGKDSNLIYSDDPPTSILSPDGMQLFFKPWYTRIGEPTNCTIGNFTFGGIISSWKIAKSTDGFFYECVITDPSEILKGVNVIVSNYKGPSGYFNVINALGYIEAVNDGIPYNIGYKYGRYPKQNKIKTSINIGSEEDPIIMDTTSFYENESNFNYNINNNIVGMRIGDIAYALNALLRAPSPIFDLAHQNGQIQTPRIYGGPIVYGHRETMNWFAVDLSIFNLVKENYFVEGNGGVINLYDLFSMICKDSGYDMIITLSGNNIIPKFIDRKNPIGDNIIPQAIQNMSSYGSNIVDSSYGYELIEQNTTGQLLIGSPKEVFYQTSAIRPVYGSFQGNPILGVPGEIQITLPCLVQFNNVGLQESPRLGQVGEIVVDLTQTVNKQKVVIGKKNVKIGFHSKKYQVEFVKIPLPKILQRYFGETYITNSMEMLTVKSQNGGAVLWEKFLKISKPEIWYFLYGYQDDDNYDDENPAEMPKDHNQTGSNPINEIYEEKMGYSTVTKDGLANQLFQVISSYAESWGKYWAVSLPDKANTIGIENEYNISSSFKSMNFESESYYPNIKNPFLGQRKLHYAVKDQTYIDPNPKWNDSNIYYPKPNEPYIIRSTVVNSSDFLKSNEIIYPMNMEGQTLEQFLSDSQSVGPIAKYENSRIILGNDKTLAEFGDELGQINAFPDEEEQEDNKKLLIDNFLEYSGNDFLNGIYMSSDNQTLFAKGVLSEQLTFMDPDFTTELDKKEEINSLIQLRKPHNKYGFTYEESFYNSENFSGAYNDFVFGSYETAHPYDEKILTIINRNSIQEDLNNPALDTEIPIGVDIQLRDIYSKVWHNRQKKYNDLAKPYIYGYFTVIETPNYPVYGMSKKAEMQEFLIYLEGLDSGNEPDIEDLASSVAENVFPSRMKGPPISPSLIGVPLSLTFDNWVFRDDPDAYGKTSRSKYPYIGKVEVEIDESLNPETYGGFQYFFSAAQAKITGISPQRQNESGSITFVGLPTGALGDNLTIDGNLSSSFAAGMGPALTGINISFDAKKVSTTYEFKNFAPRFGVTSREYIERIKKTGNQAQKARMLAVKQSIKRSSETSTTQNNAQYVSRYHDRQPPHEIIYFRQFDLKRNRKKRITAKSGTEQECLRDLKPNLNQAAMASWDAFLEPYSLRSLHVTGLNYAYGITPSENSMTFESGKYIESSNKVDNWAGFTNPKINIIKTLNNIKNYQELSESEKEIISLTDEQIKKYKYLLNKLDNDLTDEEKTEKQYLEDILYKKNSILNSVNNILINPFPKESNVDTVLYKTDKDNVSDIRGHKGKIKSEYVTSIGLKGPLVITGWGVDKHFSSPGPTGGLKLVGTGCLIEVTGGYNSYPSGVKDAGDNSKFLTGPVDLLWDSYRGTWSTKDTELVYVKSYEKMPSGHFGYLANCIPLNFIEDFNATGSLKNYPMIATGLASKESWKDNLKKITAGTGDGFKSFYSIKPQTGCIYTTTFINNSVSNTSGICSWMLNPEAPIMGIYSSGSIYDMFGRIFNENIDFMHPEDFDLSIPGSLTITNFSLVDNVVTLTYSGISNYTIGDKIKIELDPPNPTYDGEYVITKITGNTISYTYYGDDTEIDGDKVGYISEPEYVPIAKRILRQKASQNSAILLKVFPASKATYNVIGIGGGTSSTGVKSVQCVNNILVVTYS